MKRVVILCLLVSCFLGLSAQTPIPLPRSLQTKSNVSSQDTMARKPERKVHFTVGGNVQFQLSNNELNFQLSPHIGVLPTDWLCIGIGASYRLRYYKYGGVKYTENIIGGNAFMEGYICKRGIVHAEYELLSFPQDSYFPNNKLPLFTDSNGRPAAHTVLIGPGYKQQFSDASSMYFLVLFCVYDPQYIRGIADIRVGYSFKF